MENPAVSVISQFTTTTTPSREKNLDERRRDAIVCICVELVVAVTGFAVALRAYLVTTNMKAGAFWSHIALVLACLFLLIGVCLQHQGRTWMIVGMVSNVTGILMAFIGTLVDGAQAGHIAQTKFQDCGFSQHTTHIHCYHGGPAENYNCEMLVYENSCYCCYIFRENHCDASGFSLSTQPTIFRGVDSCHQVESEYQILLWTSMAFNLIQFIVATVTVSIVGRYKSLMSQLVHPTTVHQMIVGPSVIGGSLGATGGPLVIFNQQTVGYYPHVTNPPDYNEAVGVGPPPAQPGRADDMPPVDTTPITLSSSQGRMFNKRPSLRDAQPPPPFYSEGSLPPPYAP